MNKFFIKLILLLLAAGISACSSHPNAPEGFSMDYKPKEKKRIYTVATRQLPPEPVYGRLEYTRPPHVLPKKKPESMSGKPAPRILPVVQFTVDDKPFSEVAMILAATARYDHYCSSLISDNKFSINTLGTIDEIGDDIADKGKIRVIVDHVNRQVRFLAAESSPEYFNNKVIDNEYKSTSETEVISR